MKKRNIILIISCVAACGIALLMIFRGYYTWSENTFSNLMYENQEAYAQSQSAEVIAEVEDVTTTLKTLKAILESCSSEEEMHDLESAMNTLGESKEMSAQGVHYFSFSEINMESMSEEDKRLVDSLRSGESVISEVYTSDIDGESYYGIAEPVYLNGESVGFVRGMIRSDTLLYSSQTGFLREEIESYLIHKDGNNAQMGDGSENEVINMFDVLYALCENKAQVDELIEAMDSGEDVKVVQAEAEGRLIYISCAVLPYNDWMILSINSSEEITAYIDAMADGGRKAVLAVVITAGLAIAISVLYFYLVNKERRRERERAMMIANFSDTVLCDYEIAEDRISCTSNISKMLDIQSTVTEYFLSYIEKHSLIHPEDREIMKQIISATTEKNEIAEYEIRLKSRQGEYRWYRLQTLAPHEEGKIGNHIIIKITDIAEEKKEMLGLRKKNQTDVLTGLLNRETFDAKVKERIADGTGGYLFLIDVDNFKEINDTYGHQSGDEFLKRTADCMRSSFREEDYIGRYGGDEFLAFIPGTATERTVQERAEMLMGQIREQRLEENRQAVLTCSVGIAKYEGGDYEVFLKKADDIMYKVKEQGRDSWLMQ